MIMYHCTKRKFLDNILKNGLVPNIPYGIRGARKGVYLSLYPFDWMDFVTNKTTEAGVLIKVNVLGLNLYIDNGIEKFDWLKHPSFIYDGVIKKDRFVEISVSTDENPSSFEIIEDWE